MSAGRSARPARAATPPTGPHTPRGAASGDLLLLSLVSGASLEAVVPLALEVVERDPLATAGRFRGDILRALMEVPGAHWARHPAHYDRYRAALRAAASQRRGQPPDEQMRFWQPLPELDGDGAAAPGQQRDEPRD
ncbi:MAG TPA: contact-dependent growth inhibition system immunity protein [Gemmatimonadaceae bacterium]|nr:contact-dependent growth inhibition system immunity protein [Gemmatimonadaceae bacterium]